MASHPVSPSGPGSSWDYFLLSCSQFVQLVELFLASPDPEQSVIDSLSTFLRDNYTETVKVGWVHVLIISFVQPVHCEPHYSLYSFFASSSIVRLLFTEPKFISIVFRFIKHVQVHVQVHVSHEGYLYRYLHVAVVYQWLVLIVNYYVTCTSNFCVVINNSSVVVCSSVYEQVGNYNYMHVHVKWYELLNSVTVLYCVTSD